MLLRRDSRWREQRWDFYAWLITYKVSDGAVVMPR